MRQLFSNFGYFLAGGMLLISFATVVVADPALTTVSVPPVASYLAQLVGGLVFVIMIILVFAGFARRLQGVIMTESPIEILATRAVGTRERLMLIQLGEEQILIGLSPTGFCHLYSLKNPIVITPQEPLPNNFASLLQQVRISRLKK